MDFPFSEVCSMISILCCSFGSGCSGFLISRAKKRPRQTILIGCTKNKLSKKPMRKVLSQRLDFDFPYCIPYRRVKNAAAKETKPIRTHAIITVHQGSPLGFLPSSSWLGGASLITLSMLHVEASRGFSVEKKSLKNQ